MNTRKARKQHECILCKKEICKGTDYVYQRVTPWDHIDNEFFFDYKAHIECDNAWHGYIGDEFGWLFPQSGREFLDYMK